MVTRYTQGMGTTSTVYQAVREQALKLGEDERELLMVELGMSLGESSSDLDVAFWAAEVKRRIDSLDAGESGVVGWDEAEKLIFDD